MFSPNPTTNNWSVAPKKSGPISIGTHNLHLSISGPPHRLSEPLIIIFPGAGDTTASWLPVSRLISAAARTLLYDRSGLGHSERGPSRAIATIAAAELHTALDAAALAPPYVLCAHSYGAIVAREFLHAWPDEVAGMVLAEAATERQCRFFRIPDPDMEAVMGRMNFARVTGLRGEAKMSTEEWRERAMMMARGAETAREEAGAFVELCETLGEKRQIERRALGERPLSVIRCSSKRDYERIYKSGVEAGNGTEEQRKAFRRLLNSWEEVDKDLKEEQLRLSSNSRLVYLPECGHNVELIRPDVVANEIQWVVETIMKDSETAIPSQE